MLLSVIFGVALGLAVFPFLPRLETPSVALAPLLTPAIVAVARPTFTPTVTPTAPPTPTPTQTPTPTLTPSPTPTTPVIRTTVPTATGTATPTPKPEAEPPVAVSPKDQAEFGGEDTEIYIQWEGSLQEGQQYAVTVRYVGHGDETKVVGTRQKQTRWRLPNNIFKDISITLRALKWDVTVIDMSGVPLSAPSESRIFTWHP
jgi:hypothetical protein